MTIGEAPAARTSQSTKRGNYTLLIKENNSKLNMFSIVCRELCIVLIHCHISKQPKTQQL